MLKKAIRTLLGEQSSPAETYYQGLLLRDSEVAPTHEEALYDFRSALRSRYPVFPGFQ